MSQQCQPTDSAPQQLRWAPTLPTPSSFAQRLRELADQRPQLLLAELARMAQATESSPGTGPADTTGHCP